MTDQQVMKFLIALAGYVAQLHERSRTQPQPEPESNASGRWDNDTVNWEHEGFARWMGWRGEAEQEREIREQREKT